jgi:hypothetical protein
MAKSEYHRKRNGSAAMSDTTNAEATPESLDKVRDILFGGQMRAVDTRLRSLEERIAEEQQAMRSEFNRQLAELDTRVKRDVASLGEEIAAERTKRSDDLKALAAELKEAIRNLEKRHARLEESSMGADAELRESLLIHSKSVATEQEKLSQRFTSELSRTAQELRHDKLSISTLGAMFSDMSEKLANEAKTPAKSAPRG